LLLTARPELRSLRRRTGTWGDELKLPPTDQTDGDDGGDNADADVTNPVARELQPED
jgi:hypothetical protein